MASHPLLTVALVLFMLGNIGFAEDNANDPIRVLTANPQPSVFRVASREKPLVLRSQNEASKYFAEKELAKLSNTVDFDAQFLLVFAWRGSGQDQLTYQVAESSPEQITFTLRRGLTRDLRPHVQVYVLRSDVKWGVR